MHKIELILGGTRDIMLLESELAWKLMCVEPMTQTLPNWSVEPTCIFSLCLDKAHMDPFSASSR